MPVKACDKLLSYNSCKGNGSEVRPIRCSNCGEKLIKGAKFCDICGTACSTPEHQEYLKKRKRTRWIILIIVGCIVLAIVGAFIGWLKWLEREGEKYSEKNNLAEVEATVTPEEFEKIQMGMTREEVEEIIGGKGKVMYESEFTIEYAWPGEYYIDEEYDLRLTASFDRKQNALDELDEDNIIFGKERRAFKDMQNSHDYSNLKTPIVKRKQLERLEEGMSYSEVTSILGGDGMKCSERRNIRDIGRPEYPEIEKETDIEYAWKCIEKKTKKEWYVSLDFKDGELHLFSDPFLDSMIE